MVMVSMESTDSGKPSSRKPITPALDRPTHSLTRSDKDLAWRMLSPWIQENPTPLAFIELGHYLLVLKVVQDISDEDALEFLVSREKFRLHLLSYPEQRFKNCFDLLDRYQVSLSLVLRTFPAARAGIEAELSFWLRSPRPKPSIVMQTSDVQVKEQGSPDKRPEVQTKKPEAEVPMKSEQVGNTAPLAMPKTRPHESALLQVKGTAQRQVHATLHEKVSVQQREMNVPPANSAMFGLKLSVPAPPRAPEVQPGDLPAEATRDQSVKRPLRQVKFPAQSVIDQAEVLRSSVRQFQAPAQQTKALAPPARIEALKPTSLHQLKLSQTLQRRLVDIGCFNPTLSEDETVVRSLLANHRHFRLWLSVHMPDQRKRGLMFLMQNPAAEPHSPLDPAFWPLFRREVEQALFTYQVNRIARLRKKLASKALVWTDA